MCPSSPFHCKIMKNCNAANKWIELVDYIERLEASDALNRARDPTVKEHIINDVVYNTYHCPVCGYLVAFDDYFCPCGQRLRGKM